MITADPASTFLKSHHSTLQKKRITINEESKDVALFLCLLSCFAWESLDANTFEISRHKIPAGLQAFKLYIFVSFHGLCLSYWP
jgi:hypothetical protein